MVDWKAEEMDPGIKAALQQLEKAIDAITNAGQQKGISTALRRLANAWEAAYKDAADILRPLPKGRPW